MADFIPSTSAPKVPSKPKRDALGKFMVGFALVLFILAIANLALISITPERDQDKPLIFGGFLVLCGIALIFSSK